ncbi:phosphatidylserine/phosphatidylglycerophosphate/cardiolipin synthase family protein [Bradyrhizobium tunisiense]|uniref:phosphatidylserine/phosphatidylglycerophosphate/ cardiolipin synthase family protein n=1 Tax=Bradyrhizobium tunisiense TaxID=3278709 RepID=UPI0035D61040
MKIDPEALYRQLGHLVATMPDLNGGDWTTPDGQRWLGRAAALVQASGANSADVAVFNVASNNLGTALHTQNVQAITAIVHRALANAELVAPASSQGAFIAVGESFSALAAVSKVLAGARQTVLIVDPYADAKALTDFAVLASEGVLVRILSDASSVKPSLKPAAENFMKQYGAARPLEVRLSPARSLHDRIITVDDADAWTLTQSLKDFAARSPATIVKVDAETATLKVSAYGAIWQAAAAL